MILYSKMPAKPGKRKHIATYGHGCRWFSTVFIFTAGITLAIRVECAVLLANEYMVDKATAYNNLQHNLG